MDQRRLNRALEELTARLRRVQMPKLPMRVIVIRAVLLVARNPPRFPFSAGCIIITLGFRFSAAQLMRLADYGVAVGKCADLVGLDAVESEMAVAEMAAVLYALKRGRMTVSREPGQLHRAT